LVMKKRLSYIIPNNLSMLTTPLFVFPEAEQPLLMVENLHI
jgi:hypothetical protein